MPAILAVELTCSTVDAPTPKFLKVNAVPEISAVPALVKLTAIEDVAVPTVVKKLAGVSPIRSPAIFNV